MDYRIAVDSDAPLLADINQQLIRDEWGGGGMELEHLEARMRRWIEEGDYTAVIFLEDGATVVVDVRGRSEAFTVTKPPFVQPSTKES